MAGMHSCHYCSPPPPMLDARCPRNLTRHHTQLASQGALGGYVSRLAEQGVLVAVPGAKSTWRVNAVAAATAAATVMPLSAPQADAKVRVGAHASLTPRVIGSAWHQKNQKAGGRRKARGKQQTSGTSIALWGDTHMSSHSSLLNTASNAVNCLPRRRQVESTPPRHLPLPPPPPTTTPPPCWQSAWTDSPWIPQPPQPLHQ